MPASNTATAVTSVSSDAVHARRIALRGDLLDLTGTPQWGDVDTTTVRYRPDHWLLIEDGLVKGAQPFAQPPDASWQQIDHAGKLIMPGFIDSHVHSPQLDVIGAYGTELLDWLNTYTFPAEMRFADPAEAHAGAERFLDILLATGTTTAVVFPTVHKVSAETLFASAHARNMRVIAGKILMDRHAPPDLCDDVAQAERDCIDLIERWHGKGRLSYAVTPRFAPTSTPEQLAMAGRLVAAYEGLYSHSHVAENQAEVRWVHELFPEARSYMDVYARAGLVNERSVFAHGIWLDDEDRALLRDTRAQIAHSPSSNLFLGSGLFAWRAAVDGDVPVTLASDVGGGTSLSMIRTMAEAYKVQAMAGQRLTAWKVLHAATLGSAQALHLDHEIGSLDVGKTADVCVWSWADGALAERRMAMASNLHDRFFAWMTLADERNLQATYVAGVRRYQRSAH